MSRNTNGIIQKAGIVLTVSSGVCALSTQANPFSIVWPEAVI